MWDASAARRAWLGRWPEVDSALVEWMARENVPSTSYAVGNGSRLTFAGAVALRQAGAKSMVKPRSHTLPAGGPLVRAFGKALGWPHFGGLVA